MYITKSLISTYEKNSTKDKSQIQAAVLSEDMTWKTFTDLVSNLLDVKTFSISITLTHRVKDKDGNHKVTVHHVDATPNNDINSIKAKYESDSKLSKTKEGN